MIKWEDSQKQPGTTWGRVGEVLFFRISSAYNYKRILSARSFAAITTKDTEIPQWIRVGHFEKDEAARKAAEEQWEVYLKRLGLKEE